MVVQVDGVELATRLATGTDVADERLTRALAVADRIVIGRHERITDTALAGIRAHVIDSTGFARVVDADVPVVPAGKRLDAWHGAPAARPVTPASAVGPCTVVLRVDGPLDADATDAWLDLLVAQHGRRLVRMQGALAVRGQDVRTCLVGVRSFALSHSGRDHAARRSAESVLAICGTGLDREELTAGFLATIAS